MNEHFLSIKTKPLIDTGACNLHIVHNAFRRVFGFECVPPLRRVTLMSRRFRRYPKSEEFTQSSFHQTCSFQMADIGEAVSRVIEQFRAIKHNFLKFIAKMPLFDNTKIQCNL